MAFPRVLLALLPSILRLVDCHGTRSGAEAHNGAGVVGAKPTLSKETGATTSFIVYSSQASLRGYDSASDGDFWITETAYLEPRPTPTTSRAIVVRTGITSSAYFTSDNDGNTHKVPGADDGPRTTQTAFTLFPPGNGFMSDNKPYWGDFLPCAQSALNDQWNEDDRCVSRGGHTGCGWNRQCDYRDGIYWCSTDVPQGRACWWTSDQYYYQPLGEPCLEGDRKLFCVVDNGTVPLLPDATPSLPEPIFSDRPTPLVSLTTATDSSASTSSWPPDVTTPPPTSYPYPTTMSTLRSDVVSVTGAPANSIGGQPIFPQDFTSIVIEPRPLPTTYPATVVQTSIVIHRSPAWGLTSYETKTAHEWYTWILHEPKPTHVPAGVTKKDLTCQESCAAAPWKADLRCDVGAQLTGCKGQCELRDGVFWCLRRFPIGQHNAGRNTPEEYKRGRACWWDGGDTVIYPGYDADLALLGDPCDVGDNPVGCWGCPARENGTLILGIEG